MKRKLTFSLFRKFANNHDESVRLCITQKKKPPVVALEQLTADTDSQSSDKANHRHHNFDCSQLISFRLFGSEKKDLSGLGLFEALGFTVLLDADVKVVKKEYFAKHDDEFFIELEDKEFIGELEDWCDVDNPPQSVVDFAKTLLIFKEMNELKYTSIFISVFAELGRTSNCNVDISPDALMETLYFMSRSNFDVWVDNLAIRLID